MSEENCSLKEYFIEGIPEEITDTLYNWASIDERWYKKEDIETLRQKLIEDIDECIEFWKEDELNTKELKEHYIDAFISCKKNINKRFGVE